MTNSYLQLGKQIGRLVYFGLLKYSVLLLLVAFFWIVDAYQGLELRTAWFALELWLILGVVEGLARFAIEKWRPNTLMAPLSPKRKFIRQMKISLAVIVLSIIVADNLPSRFQHILFISVFKVLAVLVVLLIIIDNVINELELRRRSKL